MADPVPAALLELRAVAAGYGGRSVVSGIDLTLRRGEILGLLGANGSGKSTLVKAFTGQLPLLAGSVAVDGIDMTKAPEAAKARLGLAVDVGDVPTPLTGLQYLDLVASIRRCAPMRGRRPTCRRSLRSSASCRAPSPPIRWGRG